MSTTTDVRKITVKTVLGIKSKNDEAKAQLKEIAKTTPNCIAFVGTMNGWGSKATQYGESHFITGELFAKNLVTGEVFESSKAYLPSDITEVSIAAFNNREANSEGIKIQATISIVEDASLATGYTFISKPIKTPQSVNRAAEMLGALHSVPAPKLLESKKKAG